MLGKHKTINGHVFLVWFIFTYFACYKQLFFYNKVSGASSPKKNLFHGKPKCSLPKKQLLVYSWELFDNQSNRANLVRT